MALPPMATPLFHMLYKTFKQLKDGMKEYFGELEKEEDKEKYPNKARF